MNAGICLLAKVLISVCDSKLLLHFEISGTYCISCFGNSGVQSMFVLLSQDD